MSIHLLKSPGKVNIISFHFISVFCYRCIGKRLPFLTVFVSILPILFGCGVHNAGQSDRKIGTVLFGFRTTENFGEQERTFRYAPDIRIHINAPSPDSFDPGKPVELVLYALPNGNTIEWTTGKKMQPGDDWHFDIQHIAAQTRFLRTRMKNSNIVVAYLETRQKSWPAWTRDNPEHVGIVRAVTDSLLKIFSDFDTHLVLTGHSGGGRFIFNYLDGSDTIPGVVGRISFLDSDYGYEERYAGKLADWLSASDNRYLSVIAYNDSVALYNSKPVVSPTGGTWYRSRLMQRDLSRRFSFRTREDEDFTKHFALKGRIQFILKKNPERKILHTVQVELNGFMQGMLSGTGLEGKDYEYYGERAYTDWLGSLMPDLKSMTIPPRKTDALTGSSFMKKINGMSFEDREREIFMEISQGNLPSFMRNPVRVESVFRDAAGTDRTVVYEVMPDYLAIGGDDDYIRIPMGPVTAQKIADLFGASLPTRKLVDDIYLHAALRPEPVTYYPVGNNNEKVFRFVEHDAAIDIQLRETDARPGDLIAGIKKDVVIANRLLEPDRPGHVAIYGWHRTNGKPIQPLTNIHIGTYVDYSHGIRLVNSEVMVDGVPMNVADILRDKLLYTLLSDEEGIMKVPRYLVGGNE